MKVTYFGTTMLLFDDGKDQIMFDCHVTRPSLKKVLDGMINSDKKIVDRVVNDFDITRLKGIFISHSHHDHILDAPAFAVKCGCSVYGSYSTDNIALGNGVSKDKIYNFSDSMEYQIGDFKISVIPSIHSAPHWYNNDIGQVVAAPFTLPASRKAFKEGGSVDFLITHNEKKYLIRPSYNYIEKQFEDIQADVLFLGVGGLSKDKKRRRNKFFEETIGKVRPDVVVPIHWDNFFVPLYGDVKGLPHKFENTGKSMRILAEYCRKYDVECLVQLPLTSIVL